MKRMIIFAAVVCLSLFSLKADVSVKEDGHTITIKNEQVKIMIDLSRGARVGSYVYRGFDDEELIYDYIHNNGGMFKDLWTIQGWPGEFNKRLYKHEILKNGPDEVKVRTWTVSTGESRGQKKKDISDLELNKTFTLKKGERILTVDIAVKNLAKVGRRPAYWSQHAVDFDKTHKNNIYWRPTRFAVDWITDDKRVSDYNAWYIARAIAGWNGVTNAKLKRGLMFLMDYNDLQHLYDNTAANTVEWMYDDVAVPVGKTWKTRIQLIPTQGFAGYVYADPVIVANLQVKEVPAGLKITHTLTAATRPLKNVEIKTRVCGIRDKWVKDCPVQKKDAIDFNASDFTLDVSGIGSLPCVIKVDVTGTNADGKSVSIHYEDFFGGSTGRNMSLETLEPLYEFKVPEKKKQYLKPDKIGLARKGKPKILFIKGLWADFNGIEEALAMVGDVDVVNGWMKKSALGETLGNFPASYEELLDYDAIILGNVSGPMLTTVGQEMVADFVKAGGGLLFLGGDRTYGQTKFSNKNFAKLLPLKCDKPNDYGKLKTVSGLKLQGKQTIGDGVAFDGKEAVLYTHFEEPASGFKTLAVLEDGTPAVVVSDKDNERVAAVTILPFGEAPQGKQLYGDNKNWQKLMANTIKWMLRK